MNGKGENIMCKYYGYIRVSTATQAEKGGGLDVQESAIRQYAKDNHITLTEVFKDEGVSGTKESRPGLDRLLIETIKDGDTIIVHNTSRLWRDIFAQATIMKAVMNANANILSIDDPDFDVYKYMNDPSNFMISSMMGMLDQWERMTIARKLARGRATKAHKGNKPAGLCPYGYKYADDKKSVIIDEEQAKVVRYIFSEAQKGKSMQSIADDLNEQEIPSRFAGMTKRTKVGDEVPFSGKWNRGAIHAIAHNRFYIGELEHDGQVIAGNHEPIISKVQFGKVNSALTKRHK